MTHKIPVKDLHDNVIGEAEVDENKFISMTIAVPIAPKNSASPISLLKEET